MTATASPGDLQTNSARLGWNSTNKVDDSAPSVPLPPPDAGLLPQETSVTVVRPSLGMTKRVTGDPGHTGSRHVVPGDVLTYTITVVNSSAATAYDVQVADQASATLEWVTPQPPGSTTPASQSTGVSTVTRFFAVARLDPGQTATITYQLRVPATFAPADELPGADLENTASVSFGSMPFGTPERRVYTDVPPQSIFLEVDLVGSMSGQVWFDQNQDELKASLEPGAPALTVRLVEAGGATYTVTTDSQGRWTVNNLPPGEYTVTVINAPAGITVRPPIVANPVILLEGDAIDGVDIPLWSTLSIGDAVFLDDNGNHIRDAGEAGRDGVTVTARWFGADGVLGGTDDVTFSAITAGGGGYLLKGLPAGGYQVSIDPSTTGGLVPGIDLDGASPGVIALTLAANNAVTVPGAGSVDKLDIDFPLETSTASLAGTVWTDLNRDFVIDPTEELFAGARITITWTGRNGLPDRTWTTTTDALGRYSVTGLPAGSYQVRLDPTSIPVALQPLNDRDGPPDITLITVTVAAGSAVIGQDFSLIPRPTNTPGGDSPGGNPPAGNPSDGPSTSTGSPTSSASSSSATPQKPGPTTSVPTTSTRTLTPPKTSTATKTTRYPGGNNLGNTDGSGPNGGGHGVGPSGDGSGTMPFTGIEAIGLLFGGLLLVAAGALIVAWSRRRGSDAPPPPTTGPLL